MQQISQNKRRKGVRDLALLSQTMVNSESFFYCENLVSTEIEQQEDGSSSSKLPLDLTKFRGWRLVESIGYSYEFTSGGSFVLYGDDNSPVLARAFPVNDVSYILVEAVALRQALTAIIELGEEKVLFCSSCKQLIEGLQGTLPVDIDDSVECILSEISDLACRIPRALFAHRPRVMWWVLNFAMLGAQCQQHIQADRPLMQEMGLL